MAPGTGMPDAVATTPRRECVTCAGTCDSATVAPIRESAAVLRRLANTIPRGPGVFVAGDLLDLAMLSVSDMRRTVVLILHGDDDYYYELAAKHDAIVHAYVVASRKMERRLVELMPHRASTRSSI